MAQLKVTIMSPPVLPLQECLFLASWLLGDNEDANLIRFIIGAKHCGVQQST